MTPAAKILVIRNSALGDVAMTLPVVYSVARAYPDTEFYMLTRPFFAKIFIGRPDNVHIIEADFKAEYRGVAGLCRLIRRLYGYRFTAVADLHNVLRSWIIDASMLVAGKRVRMVDKKRELRVGLAGRDEQPSFIDRYAQVFRRLGFDAPMDFTSLFDSRQPEAAVEVSHPAVGIAPFARYPNKTYPPELMARVVEALTSEGINVYLFGARGAEAQTLQQWADTYQHCSSVAGKIDITEELSIMSQLDVMVTMDSANQHLASLVDVPVVSVWGSTTPACGFYGYRQSRDRAVCLGIDCQPCTVGGSNACRRADMACLRGIDPAQIVAKVKTALNDKCFN